MYYMFACKSENNSEETYSVMKVMICRSLGKGPVTSYKENGWDVRALIQRICWIYSGLFKY